MALSDYYLCDVCGRKAFYDADLNYNHAQRDPNTGMPKLEFVSSMAVVCDNCAGTHEAVVVAKTKTE